MDLQIRKANGFDVNRISELLKGWLEETAFNYPGVCPYSHVWLANFIYTNTCFVIENDEKILGTIGMRYGTFPWNNEVGAFFCDFLIIDKVFRANGVAARLIEEVKKLSNENDMPVFLGIMTGIQADKKDRFLSMCGFEYAGGNFVYR